MIFRFFEPRSLLSRATLLFVIPALLSQPISTTGRSVYAAVPLAFTTYIGALIFFTLAYRLSPFHPLAKYPGPVIAKASKWWGVYYSARGGPHRQYKHLHDRYGDVVRIGRLRCLLFIVVEYSRIHLQAPTNSLFVTPLSFTLYLAQVACPKDHVRACSLYLFAVYI